MFYLVLHYFIFLQSGVYEVWRLVQCFRAKKTLILQTNGPSGALAPWSCSWCGNSVEWTFDESSV